MSVVINAEATATYWCGSGIGWLNTPPQRSVATSTAAISDSVSDNDRRQWTVRLVFAGTPAAAVPSLQRLHGLGFEIVAVITRPDAPLGRRPLLTPPPWPPPPRCRAPTACTASASRLLRLLPARMPRSDAVASSLPRPWQRRPRNSGSELSVPPVSMRRPPPSSRHTAPTSELLWPTVAWFATPC